MCPLCNPQNENVIIKLNLNLDLIYQISITYVTKATKTILRCTRD